MKFYETVRKNLVISKALFEISSEISNILGLTYPDYVRTLIANDVKEYIKYKQSSTNSNANLDSTETTVPKYRKYTKGFDKENYHNDLPVSTKSSLVKNGHSWKAISTL